MKQEKVSLFLSAGALLIVFASSIYFAAIQCNPDSDAYFLIENGRYILENGIPHTNPWSILPGMKIVIQQWLCSLLNYAAYASFGLTGMWRLAALENLFLLGSLAFLLRMLTKDTCRLLNCLILFELFLLTAGYITTRPYQITMVISIWELSFLIWWYRSQKPNWILILGVPVFSLLQVNYQASFLIMTYLWPLCFIAPSIKGIRGNIGKCFKTLLPLYGAMSVVSLFNPYGIDGALYLFRSSYAMKLCSGLIMETKRPEILSVSMLLIAVIILCGYRLFQQGKYSLPLFYLSIGTILLTGIASRNAWMGLLSCILLWAYLGRDEILNIKKTERFIAVLCSAGLIGITGVLLFSDISSEEGNGLYHKEAIAYLNSLDKEQIVLYTTFNTGAPMEFAGFSVYMDARPELYTPQITGGEDVLQEWMSVEIKKETDIRDFIEKYHFTHFEVTPGCAMDSYLKYADDYQIITGNENCILYERKI